MKRHKRLEVNGNKWVFMFPKLKLDANALHCKVLAYSRATGNCDHEIHVSKALGTVDVFTIMEHGRYAMPVLGYTSDARFSLSALEVNNTETDFPPPNVVKYAAGMFLAPLYRQQTILATDASSGKNRVHVPARFFYPGAFLIRCLKISNFGKRKAQMGRKNWLV